MAEGKGRLIHSDGDVFMGRWSKDKGIKYKILNITYKY